MKRRDVLRRISGGTLAAAGAAMLPDALATRLQAQERPASLKGLPPLKITDVKTILTAPDRIRLVVVKVVTSEPGLVGLRLRHLHPARPGRPDGRRASTSSRSSIGRNVDEIEDIWQSSFVSSYWRNGPVLFNAMSGVDMALWDIKGKRANMPLYQLLGGKCRTAPTATTTPAAATSRRSRTTRGRAWRPASATSACRSRCPGCRPTARAARRPPAGTAGEATARPTPARSGSGARTSGCCRSCSSTCARSSATRWSCCTTSTSACTLIEAINLCKELEPYRLFFLEDPFPPEDNGYFRLLRQQTSMPIAMGELFNTQHECLPLIADRLIDFIRIHISQIGGLSLARKVQALCEFFGVRTAWHGPGDVSPVAHAAQLALDLASYNFGIQEGGGFPHETRDVFPGCPELKNGYMLGQRGARAWASTWTRSWRRSSRSRPARRIRLQLGHDPAARRHGHPAVGWTVHASMNAQRTAGIAWPNEIFRGTLAFTAALTLFWLYVVLVTKTRHGVFSPTSRSPA